MDNRGGEIIGIYIKGKGKKARISGKCLFRRKFRHRGRPSFYRGEKGKSLFLLRKAGRKLGIRNSKDCVLINFMRISE